MIRPLAILANIVGSLSYFFGLAAFIYWLAQWLTTVLKIELSVVFSGVMELMLGPFLMWVRQIFGVQYQEMSGYQVDMSLCILVLIFFSLFMLCLFVGSMLNSIDNMMSKTVRKLEHEYYVWKIQKEEHEEAEQVAVVEKKPEWGSLLAIKLENINNEAFLASATKLFNTVAKEHLIVNQHREKLIRFSSTFHALVFSREFYAGYRQLLQEYNYFEDEAPYFRIAVQSVHFEEELQFENKYLYDLIKCVGPNQVYVGVEAKHQLERGKDQQTKEMLSRFLYAGTFYKLGHREFAEAERFCFDDEDMFKVN